MTPPRTNACAASNYPWEKPEAAPEGCRGLTQIEFDAANMGGTGAVGKGWIKYFRPPMAAHGNTGSAQTSLIRKSHENIHPRRLSRHAAHAECFWQTGRPRSHDLERSRPGHRCAGRTP